MKLTKEAKDKVRAAIADMPERVRARVAPVAEAAIREEMRHSKR